MLTFLNELWGVRLRGLSPQVDEHQQHCVMGTFGDSWLYFSVQTSLPLGQVYSGVNWWKEMTELTQSRVVECEVPSQQPYRRAR